MKEDKFESRLQKLTKRFTVVSKPGPVKKNSLRDQIVTSFGEIKQTIYDLEGISDSIVKQYSKNNLNTAEHSALTPKSHATDLPNTPVNKFQERTIRKEESSALQYLNLKDHGRFERKDGTVFDLTQYFNRREIKPTFLFQVDSVLKESAVAFMPFARRNSYDELKDLSLKQEDTIAKHEFQFRVHNLSFREYFDVINFDLLQSKEQEDEGDEEVVFRDREVVNIRNNAQYEQLLAGYREFEKYFYENKTTACFQLNFGELLTEETIAFRNLIGSIVLCSRLLSACISEPSLEAVSIHSYRLLECKFEEMVTFLAGVVSGVVQFNEMYAKVLTFKRHFFSTAGHDLEEYKQSLKGTKHDWFLEISEYVFGVALGQIYTAMAEARDLLKEQKQTHCRKVNLLKFRRLIERP